MITPGRPASRFSRLFSSLLLLLAGLAAPLRAQSPFSRMESGYKVLSGLNQTVQLDVQARPYVGINVQNAGTPGVPGVANMCLIAEFSPDGVTWDERLYANGDESVILDCLPHFSEPTRTYTVFMNPTDKYVRIRVYTYNSGTASVTVTASTVADPAGVVFSRMVASVTAAFNGAGQTLEIPTWGLSSAGFAFQTTNFVGTLVVESSALSADTTGVGIWTNKVIIGGGTGCWFATGTAFTGASVGGSIGVPLNATDYRIRVRVLAYTSGTINVRGRATGQDDWSKFLVSATASVTCPPIFTTSVRETQSTPISARDLNATKVAVKSSAGTLRGVTIVNNQAATTFIQLFNVATGGVTVGTTNPDYEFQCAANATCLAPLPAGGRAFSTAITAVATTAEKGNTGSAAGVQAFFDIQ